MILLLPAAQRKAPAAGPRGRSPTRRPARSRGIVRPRRSPESLANGARKISTGTRRATRPAGSVVDALPASLSPAWTLRGLALGRALRRGRPRAGGRLARRRARRRAALGVARHLTAAVTFVIVRRRSALAPVTARPGVGVGPRRAGARGARERRVGGRRSGEGASTVAPGVAAVALGGERGEGGAGCLVRAGQTVGGGRLAGRARRRVELAHALAARGVEVAHAGGQAAVEGSARPGLQRA